MNNKSANSQLSSESDEVNLSYQFSIRHVTLNNFWLRRFQ